MTWALGLFGLLNPFKLITGIFGSLAGSFASILTILAAVCQGLIPLMQGLSSALVWFVKEFAQGVRVILSNLSTLTVIGVVVATTGLYLHHYDAIACRQEIAIQKQVDAARARAGIPIAPPAPAPTPTKPVKGKR